MASLATLTLAIDDNGEGSKFEEDLMAVRSLSTLSVVINGRNLTYFWGKFLRKCLEECNSLTKLGLTSSYYAGYENNPYNATVGYRFMNDSREMPVNWEECLSFGLASTTSLKELTVTVMQWLWILELWKLGLVSENLVRGKQVVNYPHSDSKWLQWMWRARRLASSNGTGWFCRKLVINWTQSNSQCPLWSKYILVTMFLWLFNDELLLPENSEIASQQLLHFKRKSFIWLKRTSVKIPIIIHIWTLCNFLWRVK